jgi:hypothetical protein
MHALANRVWDFFNELHDEHSEFIVASALTMYVEMVMMRWHATCFHAFAIFANVSLLSCFLGLGIGYGLSERRRITLAWFLPLLAVQALMFGLLSNTNLGGRKINPVAEQLVMGAQGKDWSWLDMVEGNAFLAAVFVLNAIMFIPLGHLAGRLMTRLPKVRSYSLNLLGSLSGIGLFFALSLLWARPSVWLGVAALGLAPFLVGDRRSAAVSAASMAAILVALGLMGDRRESPYYSPYQVIALKLPDAEDVVPAPSVRVNHCYYQRILDCSPAAVAKSERHAKAAQYYNMPYEFGRKPGDVCVVGAGTGNDVAAALRNGARSVTAVEIDPAILYLGKRLHPERPYQDTRTKAVVNDARTFLRETDQRFDTVVYGLLDSHTNLGSMSNVRIDSFVYTVEGFRDAMRRLSPTGLLVVSYTVLDPAQGDKLYAMLQQAHPQRAPRVFRGAYNGGMTYFAGPGLDTLPMNFARAEEVTHHYTATASTVDVATDDWPFFYMKRRTYPVTYMVMIAILLGLSGWLMKRNLGLPRIAAPDAGLFFFLGAGFMLIETKCITELGLVFGHTWSVVAVAISSILIMVFAANQWVMRRGPAPHRWSFAMLGGALLLGLLVTRLSTAGFVIPLAKLVMPLVLTLPLLFAGLVFSSELAERGEIGPVLSVNLFGAMLGGFLEYNSMYWGYRSLYPLGMLLYGLAYASLLLGRYQAKVAQHTAVTLDEQTLQAA